MEDGKGSCMVRRWLQPLCNSAEVVFLIASLHESDLGEYRCTSTVFSNQLNSPVIAEQAFSVGMYTLPVPHRVLPFPLFVQCFNVKITAHSAVAS